MKRTLFLADTRLLADCLFLGHSAIRLSAQALTTRLADPTCRNQNRPEAV